MIPRLRGPEAVAIHAEGLPRMGFHADIDDDRLAVPRHYKVANVMVIVAFAIVSCLRFKVNDYLT
jgi:hypothetical protein